jgi:hypothetical protein
VIFKNIESGGGKRVCVPVSPVSPKIEEWSQELKFKGTLEKKGTQGTQGHKTIQI